MVTELYALIKDASPQRLEPKFHYLLRYPTLIKKFGPLRKLWCMRFEAYHQKNECVLKVSKTLKICAGQLPNELSIRNVMRCWAQVYFVKR